jgi:two-component system nitrogen regulation response regulator NtrX
MWLCRIFPLRTHRKFAADTGTLAHRLESFERAAILMELKRQQYRMTKAAEALGLERSHLYKKCEQLGIDLRLLRQKV